ncbi:MAG: hypothetical protein J0H20_01095, partial [Rhizobiales bacterium]|nr:hypothetical protein [Hyphomicrobiales bacterium]
TKALLEQKFRSLDTVEAWWLERLIDGTTRRGGSEWGAEVPIDALFDDYIAVSEKIGVKRKSEKTSFGMKMMKLVPGLAKVRPWITDEDMKRARQWCYALPQLHKCRDAFEQAVGQKIEWNEGDDHAPERDRQEGV